MLSEGSTSRGLDSMCMAATRRLCFWTFWSGIVLAVALASAQDDVADEPARSPLFAEDLHTVAGIQWELTYTGEVFNNTRGGVSTNGATRYRGNAELDLTYDTSANGLWEGGELYLGASNTHGETLSERFVGDWQLYSNIDSFPRPHLNQVSEYWYRHAWSGGGRWLKLGKCDGWEEFAYVDMAAQFVHTSLTFPPTMPLPAWPNPALGVVGFGQLAQELDLKLGVYDGAGDGRLWGFTTLGNNGAFLIGEARWLPKFGPHDTLPGIYRVGLWRHTGDFADETDFDNVSIDTRGFYSSAEQMLWTEPDSSDQGLGMFAQLSAGEGPSRFNRIDVYWSLGLVYRGPLPERDADSLGLMINHIHFEPGTSATIERTYETVIETYYNLQLIPWLRLQPDLQFIANPGGVERDSLLAGLRFEAEL